MATPSAFETVSVAVHVLTEDGLIVEANPAFERMFGAPREQFVGRHQAVLNTGSAGARLRFLEEVFRQAVASGSWRGTAQNRRADGSIFRAKMHIYPMLVAGHRYFVCFQEGEAELAQAEALHAVLAGGRALASVS
jgi:PAS domain S-box-containing protein